MKEITRLSQILPFTLKEVPKEAEIASHILMLRAGMMRMLSAGLYTYLPLGLRVIRKVEQIVREEMNRSGAQEVLMPTLHPDSLWKQSGRWYDMGPELMRLTDRNDREYVLGPTHEEIITDLIGNAVTSYRELPQNFYQIQTKFRDETRPRFGVMRAREFIMKDAYSFDVDEEGLDKTYWEMYRTYDRIFYRCGLDCSPVLADTGLIGGKFSHEFMAMADAGEAQIARCKQADFACNLEVCGTVPVPVANPDPSIPPCEKIPTPSMTTIEQVTGFLKKRPAELIKTLLFRSGDKVVAVLVRGDRDANPVKVGKGFGALADLADAETVRKVTRAEVGYAGPVGLPEEVEIWADFEIMAMSEAVTGANETDSHLIHVVPGRDFTPTRVLDLRWAVEGDPCPHAPQYPIQIVRGIEVGQVFKLGIKYSTSLGATYQAEDGSVHPMVMGCYGIGITRTVAAIIEQHNDEKGIIWPASVAPYDVHVISVGAHIPEISEAADRISADLAQTGLDVLYDDRQERPGFKFKDADLIGIPFQISIGQKSLAKGMCEITNRKSGQRDEIPLDMVIEEIKLRREKELDCYYPKDI